MQGIISALLLGSLAFANLTNSNENTNLTTGTDSLKATLSNIFPSGNVPQNPQNNPTLGSESQIRPPLLNVADNDAKSTSFVDQQVSATPAKDGKIYSYQVPLTGNNFGGQGERNIKILESPSSPLPGNRGQPSSSSYGYVDGLNDNLHEDFQYGSSSNNANNPNQKIKKIVKDKEKRLSKKKPRDGKMQQVSASSYGNNTQIQGAGSGFLPVGHPQVDENGHVVLLQDHHHVLEHHHFNDDPNQLNQQIEVNPGEGDHLLLPPPPPHHQIVYNGEHDLGQHQHVTKGEQHHILQGPPPHDGHILPPGPPPHEGHVHVHPHPHPHPDPHSHHELSAPKPLKPSIVHRDPHDHYDHHDKVRTLDKDQEPHHHHHHDPHDGHSTYPHLIKKAHGFEPYDYDMHKIPECAHKNKHFYNLTFCLEDHLYPLETVLWALHQYGQVAHKMITDVTYQSADNLVTALTRAEEEGYTYKHYYGANHATHVGLDQYKPPYHGYTYKTDYFKKGGYICPSDIYYGRPKRAMNTYGQWKVIVNVDHVPIKLHYISDDHGIYKKRSPYYPPHKGYDIPKKGYTQTLRMEQCIYPNAPCSYIDPHFHSKCIQKHNFVRLVAWTLEEGLHVDTFKIPIACSCHIPQPIHFYQETGHHKERLGSIVPPVNNYVHDEEVKK